MTNELTGYIVENPETKELFFVSHQTSEKSYTVYDFGGTPLNADISEWNIIHKDVPFAQAWFDSPGEYSTFYASCTVDHWASTKDHKTFTMGESILYIRNWLKDAKATSESVYALHWKAYSDRNMARSKGCFA